MNQKRGRPVGTTRSKKAITSTDFKRLIEFVKKTNNIKQKKTRIKMIRLFTLLYLTGCRCSEVIEFKMSDLREIREKKEFSLSNKTKTKKPRLIVFSDNQMDLLENIITDGESMLFDVTSGYLNIKANEVIQACLGGLYSTHSFRTGYITTLAENGANLKIIKEDIGHKNVATTLRYVKVTDESKRKAKEQIKW